MSGKFEVVFAHDAENDIWYVEASDVPGLNAEARSLDELVEIVSDLAPDLILANMPEAANEMPFSIDLNITHRVQVVRNHAA